MEIQELKKFHSIKQKASGSNELEDATELEYLRNILYEYMLGREPLVSNISTAFYFIVYVH